MAIRRNKSIAQQCRYYEVGNIFEYMVEKYINGNYSAFQGLYKELCKDARKGFISYCFSEVNPQYLQEIIQATIN
jgi:hypothetical protein